MVCHGIDETFSWMTHLSTVCHLWLFVTLYQRSLLDESDKILKLKQKPSKNQEPPLTAGWWFGTFYIFSYIGNNHPNWLSYFSEGWPNHQPDRLLRFMLVCSRIHLSGDFHPLRDGSKLRRLNHHPLVFSGNRWNLHRKPWIFLRKIQVFFPGFNFPIFPLKPWNLASC